MFMQAPQPQPSELPPVERPEFPPASLNLAPAFTPEVTSPFPAHPPPNHACTPAHLHASTRTLAQAFTPTHIERTHTCTHMLCTLKVALVPPRKPCQTQLTCTCHTLGQPLPPTPAAHQNRPCHLPLPHTRTDHARHDLLTPATHNPLHSPRPWIQPLVPTRLCAAPSSKTFCALACMHSLLPPRRPELPSGRFSYPLLPRPAASVPPATASLPCVPPLPCSSARKWVWRCSW